MKVGDAMVGDQADEEAAEERTGDTEPGRHQESHLLRSRHDGPREKSDDEATYDEKKDCHDVSICSQRAAIGEVTRRQCRQTSAIESSHLSNGRAMRCAWKCTADNASRNVARWPRAVAVR